MTTKTFDVQLGSCTIPMTRREIEKLRTQLNIVLDKDDEQKHFEKKHVNQLTDKLITDLNDFIEDPEQSPDHVKTAKELLRELHAGRLNAKTVVASKYGYFLYQHLGMGIEFHTQKIG